MESWKKKPSFVAIRLMQCLSTCNVWRCQIGCLMAGCAWTGPVTFNTETFNTDSTFRWWKLEVCSWVESAINYWDGNYIKKEKMYFGNSNIELSEIGSCLGCIMPADPTSMLSTQYSISQYEWICVSHNDMERVRHKRSQEKSVNLRIWRQEWKDKI